MTSHSREAVSRAESTHELETSNTTTSVPGTPSFDVVADGHWMQLFSPSDASDSESCVIRVSYSMVSFLSISALNCKMNSFARIIWAACEFCRH